MRALAGRSVARILLCAGAGAGAALMAAGAGMVAASPAALPSAGGQVAALVASGRVIPPAAVSSRKVPGGRRPGAPKDHRQRVSHFNVAAPHSPKLLRQLAGPDMRQRRTGTPPGLANALRGIDVAAYQHPQGHGIDWGSVAKAGIQFAAIKATEGTYYKNPYALTDLAQARAAGLSVMAYAFAIPNGNGGASSPVAQADYLISYLASAGGPMPPVIR